jgi:O-antigen ligase
MHPHPPTPPSPTPPTPDRAGAFLLISPLFLALLAFGGVHAGTQPAIALTCSVAGIWAAQRLTEGRGPTKTVIRWFSAGALAWALSFLTLVPVGSEIRNALQPALGPTVQTSLQRLSIEFGPLALRQGEALGRLAMEACLLILGLATALFIRSRSRALLLSSGLLAIGLLLPLIAALHRVTGAAYIWWFSAVPQNTELRQPFFAPFVNPNHAGAFLACVAPLTVPHLFRQHRAPRILGWIALFVLALAVWSTGSRGAMLGGTLGIVSAFILVLPGKKAIPLVVMGSGLLLGAFLYGPRKLAFQLESLLGRGRDLEDAFSHRLAIWSDAWQLIKENPWLGLGPNGFKAAWPSVKDLPAWITTTYPHNEILGILVERGIFIGTCYVLIGVLPLIRVIIACFESQHTREKALLGGIAGAILSLLFVCLVDFPLQIGAIAALGMLLIGQALALSERHGHSSAGRPALLASVTLLATVSLGGGLWSAWGHTLAPGAWGTRGAPLYVAARELAFAPGTIPLLEQSLQAEPLSRRGWLYLAEAYRREGDADGSLSALEQARAAAPRDPHVNAARGRLLRATGDLAGARAAWKLALQENLPDNDAAEPWIQEAFAGETDPGLAAAWILPERADRWRDGAKLIADAGDELMARVAYEHAFSLDVQMGVAYARQLLAWGDPWTALDIVTKVPERSCGRERVRGEALLRTGNAPAAVPLLEDAMGLCKDGQTHLRQILGEARCLTGDPLGLEVLESLIQEEPRRWGVRRSLYTCHTEKGRKTEAMQQLKALIEGGVATPSERAQHEEWSRVTPAE